MNRRESFGPRRASSWTVYLLIPLPFVFLIVICGGIYYTLTREPETVTRFKEGFRFPESVPDWLGRAGGEYASVRLVQIGERLPYVTFDWEVCADTGSPKTRLSLSIALERQEMDMGGQSRVAVEVEGVQGWLSRLDILDFVLPNRDDPRYEDYRALRMEWDYDRHIYSWLMYKRQNFLNPLAGPAIALQWNREGYHYLLFAEDREPLNADVLMGIANSMAPFPYPKELGDISPGRPSSRSSDYGVRCPVA